jgi:hypothetical protein
MSSAVALSYTFIALFLKNLGSRLFQNRLSRRLILEASTEQCRRYCENGEGLIVTEGADAKRIRMTGVRVAQIRRFPDSIHALEVYRRLRLDKQSRAAQCQVSRDMKSAGFASRG